MASNTTISIADGASTPVTHVFSPQWVKDGNSAMYQNLAETMVGGRETASLSYVHSAKVRRVKGGLRLPRVQAETINGLTVRSVADFGQLNVDLIIPNGWSAADAKNLRVLGSNYLLNAIVAALVESDEFVW